MNYLKAIAELLRDTAVAFGEDKASTLAASLAYYTIFALSPLLIISVTVAVTIANRLYGQAAFSGELMTKIQTVVGPDMASMIEGLLKTSFETSGTVATIISVLLLLSGASSIFGQLKMTLNIIWRIAPQPTAGLNGIFLMVWERVLSALMVMIIGLTFLLSISVSAVVNVVGNFLTDITPLTRYGLPVLDFLVSFGILTLLFALLFRTLPDAQISWRDALVGAAVTTLLFNLGEYLIGLYLSTWNAGAVYGVASSLVILLLWIYYSAQIFLLGAEFTHVFANKYGHKVTLKANVAFIRTEIYHPPVVVHEPQPVPGLTAVPILLPPEPPEPTPSPIRTHLATGLVGLALGLFLGFLGSLRRQPAPKPTPKKRSTQTTTTTGIVK